MSTTHIEIVHAVPGSVREVFDGFTEDLFLALSPAFPPAKLLRYDGNRPGDTVELLLGVWPLRRRWVSRITDYHRGERECYFVDEGVTLPPPLTYWRHRHVLTQVNDATVTITEDIAYRAIPSLLAPLIKPVIAAQFEARGPKYRSYFAR